MRDPPGEAEQGWGVEGDTGLEAGQGDEKGKVGTLDKAGSDGSEQLHGMNSARQGHRRQRVKET